MSGPSVPQTPSKPPTGAAAQPNRPGQAANQAKMRRIEEAIARNVQDHGTFQTVVNEYGIFAVDLSHKHRPAMRTVLAGMQHEPNLVKFMCRRCGTGDVIQAGAYFGDFLPALAGAVAPGALVWSFEASARNHALAARTVALNGLDNVRLFHNALSDESRTVSIVGESEGKPMGGLSRVVEGNLKPIPEDAVQSAVQVQAVRLDDVVPSGRRVSIVQLDIEGYESFALAGATRLLRDSRPILILEMGPRRARDVVADLVPDLPYAVVGRIYQNTVLACLPEMPQG